MPSWLVELQGEVADASGPSGPGPDTAAWLASLGDAPPGTPPREASENPEWLSGPAGSMPAEPPADQQSTSSRVKMPVGATEWLRSIGQDPDAPSEPLSEPISHMEESGVPEWLRDMSADDVARGIASDVPDASAPEASETPPRLAGGQPTHDASTVSANFQALPPEADETADQGPSWFDDFISPPSAAATPRPTPPSGSLAGSAEVPAWLRDLGEDAPEPAEPEPPSEEEPAWLRHAANRPQTDRFGAAEEIEVPAWLRGADEPPPPPPATPEAAPPGPDEDIPTWLREAAGPGEPPAPPASPPSPGAPPDWLGDTGPGNAPSWLQGTETPASRPSDEAPSWLREAAPPPQEDVPSWLQDAPATPTPPQEDVPSWLQDAPATPTPPQEDVPSWLQDAPATPTPPQEDVPSWLREAEAAPPAGDVPSWLQDAPATPTPPQEDVPSWLREAEAAPPAGDVPSWLQDAPATPTPPVGDVPSWLREAEAAPPAPSVGDVPPWLREAEAAPPAPPAGDVPPWLGEPPAAPPEPSEAAPAPGDLPPWLTSEEQLASGLTAGAAADPGLPSWLRGVADETPPPAQGPRPTPPRRPVPGPEASESQSFLSGAELPSWLRVPEPERPSNPQEGQALDWLRRLGGAEQEEEAQTAGAAVAIVPQRQLYQRSAEQVSAIGLLQRLSRSPYPEPAVPVAPAPLTRWQRIGLERVLYALLTLALLVALVFPALTGPWQTAAPTAPGSADLGALLDSLDGEDVALVAYEWGAQRSGELRPLESAVISRLVARKVKLILVSTDLQGTLLAFDLVGPLRAAGYNNENGVSFGGRDYVLLGYRPGGELALRSLAQDLRGELRSDFDGQDATQSLVANTTDGAPRFSSISDLSMILVLADQPQDVQAWMEQVRPAAADVPMAFLLPQEAQPLAQPFLRMPNVYHLAGQTGALALQAADPTGDPAAIGRATGQLWYAVSIFLLLLLAGSVAALVGRRRDRGGAA